MVKINVSDRVNDSDDESEDGSECQGDKQTFLVHKKFICQYSPFFDAAFNGNFKEGTSQELDLQDTDPVAFSIFVDWLYTQTITSNPSDIDVPTELLMLVKLWVLADKLLIPRLQNETLAIFDERRSSTGRLGHGMRSCFYVYENTSEGSPLRRYFSYMASRRMEGLGSRPLATDKFRCYPRDMLIDIIEEIRNPTGKIGSEAKLPDEELQKFYVPEEQKSSSAKPVTN